MNDAGAIPVLEAIMAATLLFSGMLFLASVQPPAPATTTSDLGIETAWDALQILEARPGTVPYANALDEWVTMAMSGEGSAADAAIQELLPVGSRYVLRLHNGYEPLHLLPEGAGLDDVPVGASAAQVIYFPNWTTNAAQTAAETVAPGQQITVTSHPVAGDDANWDCLVAPSGDAVPTNAANLGPESTTWLARWQAASGVPANVPYGIWAAATDPTCLIWTYFAVAKPGVSTNYPPYGVAMVVWPGA